MKIVRELPNGHIEHRKEIDLFVCGTCGFAFDAHHTDDPPNSHGSDIEYTCPCCAADAQLAEARLAFQDMSTEREMGEIYIADLKADVRALAEAAKLFVEWYRHGADWKELSAVVKTEDALARPGVQRMLANKEHEAMKAAGY